MTYSMKLRDVRAEGKAEGKAEGRVEGRAEGRNEHNTEVLVQLVANGCPDKYILSLGFSQEDIDREKEKTKS